MLSDHIEQRFSRDSSVQRVAPAPRRAGTGAASSVTSDPSPFRLVTILADEKLTAGVDFRTLRAIRVLRPLKLVNGIPSK